MSDSPKESVVDRVFKVLYAQFGHKADNATRDSNILNDIHADSLDTVELIMALEEEFDLTIGTEDEDNVFKSGDITVDDIVKYLEGRLSKESD